MTLGPSFRLRDRIAKHGNKGKPGYKLLHPGTMVAGTRSTQAEQSLERIGRLVQEGKFDRARLVVQNDKVLDENDKNLALKDIPDGPGEAEQAAGAKKIVAERKGPTKADALVQSFKAQIANAKGKDELRRIKHAVDHSTIPGPEKSEIYDQLTAAINEVNNPKGSKQEDAPPMALQAPPEAPAAKPEAPEAPSDKGGDGGFPDDDSPEAAAALDKHFTDGGNLTDAPHVGLWNYIKKNKRFKVKKHGKAGISESYWVTDSKNGERWMVKQTHFDGIATGEDGQPTENYREALNELMTAQIMDRAGFSNPTTKLAASPGNPESGRRSWQMQRDYAQELNLDGTIVGSETLDLNDKQDSFSDDVIARIQRGSDPKALSRKIVLDYLINNAWDSHADNILPMEEPNGGLRIGIIDAGLAFAGGTQDPNATYLDEGLFGISMLDFLEHYKADKPISEDGFGASSAAARVSGTKKQLAADLQEAIDAFGKLGEDEGSPFGDIMDDMLDLGHNQDDEEYMEEWLAETMYRLEWLKDKKNFKAVVDLIAKKGGIK